MNKYNGIKVFQENNKIISRQIELTIPILKDGEVEIEANYSSLNYKDALAITGKGKILRSFPMIPGIDVAGRIRISKDARFKEGQQVFVTGCGLGENRDGGLSQIVQVPGDWIVPLPDGINLKESMIIGTAGFTAALCFHRMQINGQTPEMGDIVVTGASGGVGLFAIQIFSKMGFKVVAVSSKRVLWSWLTDLGAIKVIEPDDLLCDDNKPLHSVNWGGGVDSVGGQFLASIIKSTQFWGNVASVGLASNPKIALTVMPWILRGVSLLGISSANCPRALRHQIWQNLTQKWKPEFIEKTINQEIRLDEIQKKSEEMLARKTYGRILVNLQS